VEIFVCFPVCFYGVHRDFTFIHACLYLVAFINRSNLIRRVRIVGAPVVNACMSLRFYSELRTNLY